MWWTPLFGAAALADCTFRAPPERLVAALDAAEKAYVSLDVPEFERAMTEVDFVVPCLEAPLDPAGAARLHRMRGLGRFAAGDPIGAAASLRAARILEPAYVFSEEVLPKGFELRSVYEQLSTAPGDTERLPRARKGSSTWFDGTASRERPVEVPALWQFERDGELVETLYLEPTEPMPWYPGANKDQIPWLVGAGVTAIASAGAFGGARAAAAPVERQTGTLGEDALRSHQTVANGLTLAGGGLVVAAVGELVVGLLAGGRE